MDDEKKHEILTLKKLPFCTKLSANTTAQENQRKDDEGDDMDDEPSDTAEERTQKTGNLSLDKGNANEKIQDNGMNKSEQEDDGKSALKSQQEPAADTEEKRTKKTVDQIANKGEGNNVDTKEKRENNDDNDSEQKGDRKNNLKRAADIDQINESTKKSKKQKDGPNQDKPTARAK